MGDNNTGAGRVTVDRDGVLDLLVHLNSGLHYIFDRANALAVAMGKEPVEPWNNAQTKQDIDAAIRYLETPCEWRYVRYCWKTACGGEMCPCDTPDENQALIETWELVFCPFCGRKLAVVEGG
jgi:hypothetical protein